MGTIHSDGRPLSADWAVWSLRPVTMLLTNFLAWYLRAQSRHHLAGLDDYALKDMGLSRADVSRECAKPFWR